MQRQDIFYTLVQWRLCPPYQRWVTPHCFSFNSFVFSSLVPCAHLATVNWIVSSSITFANIRVWNDSEIYDLNGLNPFHNGCFKWTDIKTLVICPGSSLIKGHLHEIQVACESLIQRWALDNYLYCLFSFLMIIFTSTLNSQGIAPK